MRTRKLYVAECLVEYMIALVASGVFFVSLLKNIGMSDAWTGILSSMISLGCLSSVFSSLSVKKGVSIRKSIIRITLCCDILFGTIYFLPFVPFRGAAVGICCAVMILTAYVLLYICSPVKYRWFMRFVPRNERGSFTASKEIISLFGGMVFSYAMGLLFDQCARFNPNGGCLLCGSVILFLTVIQLLLLRFSDDAPEDMQNEEHPAPLRVEIALLRESAPLRKLLVMDILWAIAVYISTPYYASYLIGDLGFSVSQVTLFSVFYSVVRAAFSRPMGRYADRNGYLMQILAGMFFIAAAFLVNCFLMPKTRLLYIVYYALYAVAFAAINGGMNNIPFDYIPERNYSPAAGIRKACGGVTGFLASLVGGRIVSAMQESGAKVAPFPYPQQLLSCISLVIVGIIILYVKTVLSKLRRIEP